MVLYTFSAMACVQYLRAIVIYIQQHVICFWILVLVKLSVAEIFLILSISLNNNLSQRLIDLLISLQIMSSPQYISNHQEDWNKEDLAITIQKWEYWL